MICFHNLKCYEISNAPLTEQIVISVGLSELELGEASAFLTCCSLHILFYHLIMLGEAQKRTRKTNAYRKHQRYDSEFISVTGRNYYISLVETECRQERKFHQIEIQIILSLNSEPPQCCGYTYFTVVYVSCSILAV